MYPQRGALRLTLRKKVPNPRKELNFNLFFGVSAAAVVLRREGGFPPGGKIIICLVNAILFIIIICLVLVSVSFQLSSSLLSRSVHWL